MELCAAPHRLSCVVALPPAAGGQVAQPSCNIAGQTTMCSTTAGLQPPRPQQTVQPRYLLAGVMPSRFSATCRATSRWLRRPRGSLPEVLAPRAGDSPLIAAACGPGLLRSGCQTLWRPCSCRPKAGLASCSCACHRHGFARAWDLGRRGPGISNSWGLTLVRTGSPREEEREFIKRTGCLKSSLRCVR